MVGVDSPEGIFLFLAFIFLGESTMSEMGEAEKCPHPQGATKWYPYSPNLRAGNDSPMCPLHCLGVCLMHTSKKREIISDL